MAAKKKKHATVTTADPLGDYGDLGSGPPPAASSSKKTPIGVPKGYTTLGARPMPFGAHIPFASDTYNVQVSPLYFKGDEWKLAPTNLQDVLALQQNLVDVGLLDSKSFTPGVWDTRSASAFTKLLAQANGAGASWQDSLASSMASAEQAGPAAGQALPPLTVKLTSPDDLKSVAQKTAQTLLGGNLSDDDLNRFVTSYNQMETQYQTDAYNQEYGQYAQTGQLGNVSVTAPPSPDVELEKEVRQQHPDQVFANSLRTELQGSGGVLSFLGAEGGLASG